MSVVDLGSLQASLKTSEVFHNTMQFQLEQLAYQQEAIQAVIDIFKGQVRNTFDNACFAGIRSNCLSLSQEQIRDNIDAVVTSHGLSREIANLSLDNDLCIEMETGTGKTLVYIKTIYELYKQYGFTKFIILTPSVAIKEGVLTTFEVFEQQLEALYGFRPHYFEYESKRLSNVVNFIEEQHPQVMVMTLQSFNADDRILNQAQREDLFSNMPYIEAIARTNPLIIMDEPQEGMDTENAIERLRTLNPLFKIRYSATHRSVKNLIFRLTPYESYQQGLVKKIEVLTVAEKNDEASLKIELSKIELGQGDPKVILKLWYATAKGFVFKFTPKLAIKGRLEEITNNSIYHDYTIEQISKPIRSKGFVKFTNGSMVYEGEQAKDCASIFGEQLYWLIDTHFRKKERLKQQGIKCLSLIFIDRVANYMQPDGLIRRSFIDQFQKAYRKFYHHEPEPRQIEACQGYYFATTHKGDYTDNLRSMESNQELFDLILKDKEKLLSLENPVEFIFSHSALGVGWDNPNVFNIATLNQSYSEIKKRQEIGRGLRIAVNQAGQRVYDAPMVLEGQEINLLTVIPNETYTSFVAQYQSEIAEIYGTTAAGAETRHTHKQQRLSEKKIARNNALFQGTSFQAFWQRLSQKTDYLVAFDEERLIRKAAAAVNTIAIPDHLAEMTLTRITGFAETTIQDEQRGREVKRLQTAFAPLDLIEEISAHTSLAYPTVFRIIAQFTNYHEIVKNPPRFVHEAIQQIHAIELAEMFRALEYTTSGETFDLSEFAEYMVTHADTIQPTPCKGIYEAIVYDSTIEREFAQHADHDTEVVCFLKLPAFYTIKTPVGTYNPDFGLVLKKRTIRAQHETEYYFVIETKGTNSLEIYKMHCAIKHFEALGIEAKITCIAPVKDYQSFKTRTEEQYHA